MAYIEENTIQLNQKTGGGGENQTIFQSAARTLKASAKSRTVFTPWVKLLSCSRYDASILSCSSHSQGYWEDKQECKNCILITPPCLKHKIPVLFIKHLYVCTLYLESTQIVNMKSMELNTLTIE